METRSLSGLLGVLSTLVLMGCAVPERVVLLPEPDGSSSAVVIRPRKGGEVRLDRPYAVASVSEQQAKIESSDDATERARYQSVFEALPVRVRSYTLNFVFGRTQLTSESNALLDSILQEMEKLPLPELIIVGHADDVGSDAANDKLSLERARSVLALIKAKGIEPKNVAVVGRGKREPLYAARPGVPETRNRRVEIRIK